MSTTPEETAADLAAKVGEAAKAFADAEKTRAEADKQRADTDKVRAETEADRRLAQNKVDVAGEDLKSKQIANDLARDQATAAHTDKLVEQLAAAVPDLASLGKSTVTFGDGKALRQGESTSLALTKVAQDVTAKVLAVVDKMNPKREVFVVTDPSLVSALAAYAQLKFETSTLKQRVTEAKNAAEEALKPGAPEVGIEVAAEVGIAVAAVAGKAVTQLASLFEIDVDVVSSATDIPAYTVQTAVMGKLVGARPDLKVRHEWARVVNTADSALVNIIQELTALDIDATTIDALLDAAIKNLGDPASAVAQAEKDAKDDKKSADQRKEAEQAGQDAQLDLGRLAQLQTIRTALTAMLEKARAFAERVTKTPAAGGPSALAQAVSVEPLCAGSDFCVLILGGARAETYQVVVKRRLWFPRIETSTSVEIDYLLVCDQNVVAGGHQTASAAYAGTINGDGAAWNAVKRFEVLEAATLSKTGSVD